MRIINSQSPANLKRNLYIKIFKQELIRELFYLWDVANNRATARDNFTSKLVTLLKQASTFAPLVGSHLPHLIDGAKFVVENLPNLFEGGSFASDKLRDKKTSYVARLIDEIELPRLEIIVDIVAREAMWRYEHFIVERLSENPAEGVIPFAKVGVARVIEKLVRTHGGEDKSAHVLISESAFLSGLVEGRSGAFIEGWTNHTLKLMRQKKGVFKLKQAEINAEDVYARSGFRNMQVIAGQLQDRLYAREKPLHQEIANWKKVQSLLQGEANSLFNFGYTIFRKTQPHDPKCGYAIMPHTVIQERYDYKPHNIQILSTSLQEDIQSWQPSRILLDITTLAEYLTWNKISDQKDIRDFIEEKLGIKEIVMVACHADLTRLSLRGRNLSYMDLSGSTFSGDLTETNFSCSNLIGAKFFNVISAHKAVFYRANCAFLSAEHVDFSEANLIQTNFSYAILNYSTFKFCQTMGTIWHEAELKNIISDEETFKEQKTQINDVKKSIANQHQEIKRLNQALTQQSQTLQALQAQWQAAQNESDKQQLQELAQQVSYLVQQEEAHQIFEQYCQQEIIELNKTLQQAAQKEDVEILKGELQGIYTQLKKLITNNQENASTETFNKIITMLQSQEQESSASLTKHFLGELKANRADQDNRFKQLETALHALHKEMEHRIEQLEDRVNDLELWAEAAKVSLAKIKAEHQDNKGMKNRLDQLDAKLETLLKQQQSQKESSDRIVLLQAQIQQEPKMLQQLKQQIEVLQATIRDLAHHTVIVEIQQNLNEVHARLDNASAEQKQVEKLVVNLEVQVQENQARVKQLIYPRVLMPATDITIGDELIEGTSTIIYKGRWYDQMVAVKTTREAVNPSIREIFIREVNIMSRLQHPQIIRFYGAYIQQDKPYLVMEYCENGSLYNCIEEKKLSPLQQKQIILDLAKSLQYLHGQGILHRNLRSTKVLIDKTGRAKLAGLELAKFNSSSMPSLESLDLRKSHNLHWQPPEYIKDRVYRCESDIYSFGMILWEIVTGRHPFQGLSDAEVINQLLAAKTETLPEDVPAIYREIIRHCWQQDLSLRPTLKNIIKLVEAYDVEKEIAETNYQRALQFEKQKNYADAFKTYSIAAQQGSTRARTNLALFFLQGIGGAPQNKKTAYNNLLSSAQEGHARAMINLGQMLEYGDGVDKDLPGALHWYNQAVAKGDKNAKIYAEALAKKAPQTAPQLRQMK
ncbi:MAG: protein kinase [Pseudomonadota bacterium]